MNLQEFDVIAENFGNEMEANGELFSGLEELNINWNDLKKQLSEIKVILIQKSFAFQFLIFSDSNSSCKGRLPQLLGLLSRTVVAPGSKPFLSNLVY